MSEQLRAGAAAFEITPKDSQFLFGYPHVERYSTGVHDPLYSSALYLCDGKESVIFVTNDIIFVGKDSANRVRRQINIATGIPEANIMITATHTHSGPGTVDYISNQADPVVPKPDIEYVRLMEDAIVKSAVNAFNNSAPAQVGLALADSTGIGTNRRNPAGPADMQVPVLSVKSADGKSNIACMLVCSMHPTVLHEDSTLVSGDFPGMARQYLQSKVLKGSCPVLLHTGPAGNQSPRHVTKGNTFAEAQRLGEILAKAVEKNLPSIEYKSNLKISCRREFVDLPRKSFPSVQQARAKLEAAIEKLERLKKEAALSQQIRTAECDWFGTEETLTLAKAAAESKLEQVYNSCLPAEIQIIKIGPWHFVGWQGEIFVEYALAVKEQHRDVYVIELANGELQGYIVTAEAAAEGGYEASNALFKPQSGDILVNKTLDMLNNF